MENGIVLPAENSTPWHISLDQVLADKVPSDLRRDLGGRHQVDCFNTGDVVTETIFVKTFLQFLLSHTRPEDKERLRIANSCDNLIIKTIKIRLIGPQLAII